MMEIITKEIRIGQQPTDEMLKEVEAASKRHIRYDADCPKLTAEQLSELSPVLSRYCKPV